MDGWDVHCLLHTTDSLDPTLLAWPPAQSDTLSAPFAALTPHLLQPVCCCGCGSPAMACTGDFDTVSWSKVLRRVLLTLSLVSVQYGSRGRWWMQWWCWEKEGKVRCGIERWAGAGVGAALSLSLSLNHDT